MTDMELMKAGYCWMLTLKIKKYGNDRSLKNYEEKFPKEVVRK